MLTSAEPAPVALVGELLATQAQAQGVAGILVDGAVRDLDELAAIGLPIWTRFVRAQGATKGVVGKLDVPVVVGGAEIRSGDLVVMDCDGAMALPRERVDEVLPLALERAERRARDAASGTRPASSPTTCKGSARSWRADGGRGARPRRGRWQDRRRSRRGRLHGARLGSRPPRWRASRTPTATWMRSAAPMSSSASTAAAVALGAAAGVAGELGGDTLYADLNTASPQLKRELAAALPVRFADVALVGMVPASGLATPALASGAGAERFAELFRPLGMPVEVVGPHPGDAAGLKLLRSVFMKGMAAAAIESLEAARAAGVEDRVRADIAAGHRRAAARAAALGIARSTPSGDVEEMRAAAAYLEELGVQPRVAAAAADLLAELAVDPDEPVGLERPE